MLLNGSGFDMILTLIKSTVRKAHDFDELGTEYKHKEEMHKFLGCYG